MAHPLMPKATAVWLVENTTLTFDQIAAFCELHPLEVQGIADGEVAVGIVGSDPVAADELTPEEIERCTQDATARLVLSEPVIPTLARRPGPRYTPVAKRQNRPDAISWLLKYQPELADAQICKLVGTTKPTVNSVRERTHWNTPNINPTDPVSLGMCTQTDLDTAIQTAVIRMRRKEERDQKAAAKAKREKDAAAAAAAENAANESAAAEAAATEAPPPAAAEAAAPESAPNPEASVATTAPAEPGSGDPSPEVAAPAPSPDGAVAPGSAFGAPASAPAPANGSTEPEAGTSNETQEPAS